MNIGFAITDFMTQVLLVIVGCVLVLDPDLLVRQIDFGTTPTVGNFLIAIPVAMVAYTGIETISNMAEEARDYGKTIPRGIGLVVGAVAVIYAFLPAVALSAMPVRDGTTLLALPKEEGGYADDPVLGVVENMNLGGLQHAAEIYVGLLAATILFIATNAGILGRVPPELLDGAAPPAPRASAGAPPALPHALHRDHDLRADRVRGHHSRPGRLPRGDLCLRGDALVHDRPRLGDQAEAHPPRRGAALPLAAHRSRSRPGGAAARRVRGSRAPGSP